MLNGEAVQQRYKHSCGWWQYATVWDEIQHIVTENYTDSAVKYTLWAVFQQIQFLQYNFWAQPQIGLWFWCSCFRKSPWQKMKDSQQPICSLIRKLWSYNKKALLSPQFVGHNMTLIQELQWFWALKVTFEYLRCSRRDLYKSITSYNVSVLASFYRCGLK